MENKEDSPATLRNLVWEPGKFATPLSTVIRFTENFVESYYLAWYERKRATHRKMGRGFRIAAICLTAVGGVFPLLIDIYHKSAARQQLWELQQFAVTNGVPAVTNLPPGLAGPRPMKLDWLLDPTWAAVLLAAAATLVLLDRFLGATSGWVRFSLSAQQLQNTLTEFRFAMQTERLSWNSVEPSLAQAQATMGRVEEFVRLVDNVVLEETKTWAEEFASVLKELDQKVKSAAEAQEKGALQITVTNGDQSAKGWKLTVGNLPSEDRTGKEASLKVPPGLYTVRANGELNNNPSQAEKAVKVAAGEIQKVELTLV